MKPSFIPLANEIMENIDDLYPTKSGPLDIKTVSRKTSTENKKILGTHI